MLFEPYKVNMTEEFCILTGPYGDGILTYLCKFIRFCNYTCGTCYEDLPKWEKCENNTERYEYYRGYIEKKNYNVERFHFEDTLSLYKLYPTFRELLIMMMNKCDTGKIPYIHIGFAYIMIDKPPKVNGYVVTAIEDYCE